MFKVYHFILDDRLGGPHRYCQNLSSLSKNLIKNEIVTTGTNNFSEFSLINFRRVNKILYPIEIIINVILLLNRFLFKNEICRSQNIFHVHGAPNLAPLLAARFLKIPVVWCFHETFDEMKLFVKTGNFFLKKGNYQLVSVSKLAIQKYKLDDCKIISPCIDTRFWKPTGKNKSKIFNKNKIKITVVANISPNKGIDVLLSALKKFDGEWELDLIGLKLENYSNYYNSLKLLSENLNKNKIRVNFLGLRDEIFIRNHLNKTDVFVLPSISEALPISLLEAMAMQCICIATKVGDISKVIDDRKTGYLIKRRSVKSIKKVLKVVSSLSINDREMIGQNARKFIIKNFTEKEFLKRHTDLYLSMIRQK